MANSMIKKGTNMQYVLATVSSFSLDLVFSQCPFLQFKTLSVFDLL